MGGLRGVGKCVHTSAVHVKNVVAKTGSPPAPQLHAAPPTSATSNQGGGPPSRFDTVLVRGEARRKNRGYIENGLHTDQCGALYVHIVPGIGIPSRALKASAFGLVLEVRAMAAC